MGTDVVPVMVEQIKDLLPLLEFMTGKEKAKATKKKKQPKLKEPIRPETLDPEKQFVHVAQLKPLHIRRGFVNLTPEHWPFFAKTARSTIRHVTVNFDDNVDKDSSVWRLSSNDMARVVLSPTARDWLQDHFEPDDRVQVTGTKLDDEEIELRLEAVA
jgi:cell pole-organizing protein PopZ